MASRRFPGTAASSLGGSRGRPDLSKVRVGDPSYLQEAAVPGRVDTHAGEDVPIYATGAGSWLFHGVQEQSYVYHAMLEALGWSARETRGD